MDFFDKDSNMNTSVSGGSGKGGEQERTNNNIVYCTLSQIARLTTPDDGLVMFRQKVRTIAVVGFVESIEELTTRNVYLIRDHTMDVPLEVQLWKNDPSDENYSPPPAVIEKTDIRVIGQARFDEKKPFIIAFKIVPITNPLEVEEHIMQAIADTMVLEKRLTTTLNGVGSTGGSSMDVDNGSSNANLSLGMGGFNDIQKTVLNVIKKYGAVDISPTGLHRDEIKQRMQGVNGTIVDQAIDFLVQEGHMFSTVDDNTFQATDF